MNRSTFRAWNQATTVTVGSAYNKENARPKDVDIAKGTSLTFSTVNFSLSFCLGHDTSYQAEILNTPKHFDNGGRTWHTYKGTHTAFKGVSYSTNNVLGLSLIYNGRRIRNYSYCNKNNSREE